MKRLGYIICCLLLVLTACDDDDDGHVDPVEEKSALLTKVSRNGINQLELFYDIDQRLYRVNYYSNGTLASYNLYEYTDTGIKELRRYDADDHALDYRSVFSLDNFGRIIKGENASGPDFSEVASVNQFTYNPAGQLIKKDFSTAGDPVYSREEYTYDDQNNLIKVQRTLYPGQPEEYLNYQVDYTPGEKSVPDEWEDYVFILGLSGLDGSIREMFDVSDHFKGWNDEQETTGESSVTSSGRVFDEDGNLTRQVLTRKNIFVPQNADVVSEMTYEYTQQ